MIFTIERNYKETIPEDFDIVKMKEKLLKTST